MRHFYNETWERQKTYLVRSLFEDLPVLSPTQEEPSSPSDPYLQRPDSPLPELIIEKEPNRHDEPASFYVELEKKMLKLYKKLFKNYRDDDSTESGFTFCLDNLSPGLTEDNEVDNFSENLRSQSDNDVEQWDNESAEGEARDTTWSGCHFEQITCTAVIHNEMENETTDDDNSLVYEGSEKSMILPLSILLNDKSENFQSEHEVETCQVDRTRCDESIDLVRSGENVVSAIEENNSDTNSEYCHDFIEVMRRRISLTPSLESLRNHQSEVEDAPLGPEINPKNWSLEQESNDESNLIETEIPQVNYEINVNVETSPIITRKRSSLEDIVESAAKRKCSDKVIPTGTDGNFEIHVGISTSPITRKRLSDVNIIEPSGKKMCLDKDIQTEKMERPTWDKLKRNFLVGTPKIYNLCVCADHSCS